MLNKIKKFTNLPLSRKLQFLSSTYHKLKTQIFYKLMFKSMGAKSVIKKPMFLTPEYISVGNIMPNVTIGENSIIGANSVVTKDIPKNSVVAGNPARVIKNIDLEK